MSNERTGVDRVLDWIVPIRLSGKWMSVEVEIGISVPEDFHLEMSYVDSILDVVPGEEICN